MRSSAPQSIRARAWPYLALALLGILLQARAEYPAAYLGPFDAARNVALTRSLPDYALFDAHTYLIHPPLYAWSLWPARVVGLDLPTAAVLHSGLFTVALSLIIFALGRRVLGGSTPGALSAAVLFLVSRSSTLLGQGIWREPLQTTLLYLLFLLVVTEGRRRRPARPWAVGAALALGALMGLLWDPFVFVVPVLVVAGLLHRGAGRRLLLVAALTLALVWSGWATHRYRLLTSEPTYPTGIDGVFERTEEAGAAAFFNPNFLEQTARHNSYSWPWTLTFERPFQLLAPWFSNDDGSGIATTTPSGSLTAWGVVLLGVCLVGGSLYVRGPPPQARTLLLLATAAGVVGGPAFLGRTVRYGHALLPLLCLLCGRCVAALVPPARSRTAVKALALIVGALTLGWYLSRPHFTWGRQLFMEGRNVARAIEEVSAPPQTVCAPVGLAAEMVWVFKESRVVTLPFTAEGVPELLRDRSVDLIVLPHELRLWRRPGSSEAERDLALGLGAVKAVYELARAGELTHAGWVVEAERADRPRLRVFDLFAVPGSDPPIPRFGIFLPRDSLPAIRAVLEKGQASAESVRILRSGRPRIEAALEDATYGDDARAVLALLR